VSEERRYARVLTDLDVVLTDTSGSVLDDTAQASDISPVGFRATTRAEVKIGDKVRFLINFEEAGEKIDGSAQVVWVTKDGWGTQTVGFKFARISWRARRLLRQNVQVERYDFVALAKTAAFAIYWIVIVAAIHNVAFHQPWARQIAQELLPVMVAAALLGGGLMLLFFRG
jgi:hypothetical protein